MNEYTLFFLISNHQTLTAEKVLREAEVAFELVPRPEDISSACGLAIQVSSDIADTVKSHLLRKGLTIYKTVER